MAMRSETEAALPIAQASGCLSIGCCGLFLLNIVLVPILFIFWPSVFPFPPFQFWGIHGSLSSILSDSAPLFIFGFITNLILLLASKRRLMNWLEEPESTWIPSDLLARIPYYERTTTYGYYSRTTRHLYKNTYARGCLHVFLKGIFGELSQRWFFFYAMMFELNIANFLLFGFSGFGILHWLYLNIGRPAADFLTLYMLHPYLFGMNWTVGAAIIVTALPWWPAKHYLKNAIPTLLLTWWPGMIFFLLMFKYGLFTAVLVRFVYEIMVQLLVQVLILRTPTEQTVSAQID